MTGLEFVALVLVLGTIVIVTLLVAADRAAERDHVAEVGDAVGEADAPGSGARGRQRGDTSTRTRSEVIEILRAHGHQLQSDQSIDEASRHVAVEHRDEVGVVRQPHHARSGVVSDPDPSLAGIDAVSHSSQEVTELVVGLEADPLSGVELDLGHDSASCSSLGEISEGRRAATSSGVAAPPAKPGAPDVPESDRDFYDHAVSRIAKTLRDGGGVLVITDPDLVHVLHQVLNLIPTRRGAR